MQTLPRTHGGINMKQKWSCLPAPGQLHHWQKAGPLWGRGRGKLGTGPLVIIIKRVRPTRQAAVMSPDKKTVPFWSVQTYSCWWVRNQEESPWEQVLRPAVDILEENWPQSWQHVCVLNHFSSVQLFPTLRTVDCQAPLSVGFSRQKHWSGLPCPPPRDLPNPGIKLLLSSLH